MFNLIRSELYQIFHRKSSWIWMIFAILGTFILFLIPYLTFQFGESHLPSSVLTPDIAILSYKAIVTGVAIYLLLSIAITAYNNAIKNRTINNEISFGHSRTSIYFTKAFGAFTLALVFFILSALTFTIICLFYFKNSPDFYFKELVQNLLLPYLPLWIMYICLFTTFFILTSNQNFVGLLLFMIVTLNLIFQIASPLIDWVAKIRPFVFTELNIENPVLYNNTNITYPMIGIYIILFSIIGLFFFHRREMK